MVQYHAPRSGERSFGRVSAVLGTAILLGALCGTSLAGWRFTKIAETTSGTFSNFPYEPGLNSWQSTVFVAQKMDGTIGVYTSAGGAVATVAETTSTYLGFRNHPYINNNGTVVFAATLNDGVTNGIFTKTGAGAVVPVATTGAVDFVDLDEEPSINNSGVVAFRASRLIGGGQTGIYTKSGNTITTIMNNQPEYGLDTFYPGPRPSINNSGVVSFTVQDFDFNAVRVYKGSGDPLSIQTVAFADPLGDPSGLEDNQWINDAGVVVMLGYDQNDKRTIYRGTGGPLTKVTSLSDNIFLSLNNPTMGSDATLGTIAFDASFGFSPGIATGPSIADKVIAAGDPLFGGTVTGVSAYHAVNSVGQIAFVYNLTLPGPVFASGIAVATPVTNVTGDITGDSHVNAFDLQKMAAAWNTQAGNTNFNGRCDLNNDGKVNAFDLQILATTWGT